MTRCNGARFRWPSVCGLCNKGSLVCIAHTMNGNISDSASRLWPNHSSMRRSFVDGGAESAFIAVSAVCRDQEPLTLPSPHRYVFSVVELVALRRVAPRPAAQRLPANRPVRASRSAAARGGVVAARQPLPLNRYPIGWGEGDQGGVAALGLCGSSPSQINALPFEKAKICGRQSAARLLSAN